MTVQYATALLLYTKWLDFDRPSFILLGWWGELPPSKDDEKIYTTLQQFWKIIQLKVLTQGNLNHES